MFVTNFTGTNIRTSSLTLNNDNIKLGNIAGTTLQGSKAVAIGYGAGYTNQGTSSIAIGDQAGNTDQSSQSLAIGNQAGYNSQKQKSIAVGFGAGYTNQGTFSIAIGADAGNKNQTSNCVAIGYQAGYNSQSNNSIAIGQYSGYTNQSTYCVAIGNDSGSNDQSFNSVAIGNAAGYNNQKNNSVAIGFTAGYNIQGLGSVAIGYQAGKTNQANLSVAIGYDAGSDSQASSCVAIGFGAGYTSQKYRAIAIGELAGVGNQSTNSIAIGYQAGRTNQGTSSIAIGQHAGRTNQGQFAIAIGNNAGEVNQTANSIAINGGSTPLNPSNAGFYVNPVRIESGTTQYMLGYNLGNEIVANNTIGSNIYRAKPFSVTADGNGQQVEITGATDTTKSLMLGFDTTVNVGKIEAISHGSSYRNIIMQPNNSTPQNFVGIGINPGYQLELAQNSAAKPTSNTWTISSDARLKEDIIDADLDICYNVVKNLPIRRYKWKEEFYPDGIQKDRHSVGFIANEVQTVYPKAVNVIENQQFLVKRGTIDEPAEFKELENVLSVDVDQIYKTMYGAVKKLIEKVELLENEIEILKNN